MSTHGNKFEFVFFSKFVTIFTNMNPNDAICCKTSREKTSSSHAWVFMIFILTFTKPLEQIWELESNLKANTLFLKKKKYEYGYKFKKKMCVAKKLEIVTTSFFMVTNFRS